MFVLLSILACLFLSASVQEPEAESAQEPALSVAQIERTLECVTCKGKGTLKTDCDVCGGTGEYDCIECSLTTRNPRKARELFLRAFAAGHSLDAIGLTMRQALKQGLGTQRGRHTVSFVQLLPGELPCSAGCLSGRPTGFVGGACGYCEGTGKLRCAPCRGKGIDTCFGCAGKGKRLSVCSECTGHGNTLDPLARAETSAPACPSCDGHTLVPCAGCDEQAQFASNCEACAGTQKQACSTCLGSKKMPCRNCRGVGRTSGGDKCKVCKGTARGKCDSCKSGFKTCLDCLAVKDERFPCRMCFGTRIARCRGCDVGAWTSWERTGVRLLKAGEPMLALSYFEVAFERMERMHRLHRRSFAGDKKGRSAMERGLGREKKALEKRLKEAKAGK